MVAFSWLRPYPQCGRPDKWLVPGSMLVDEFLEDASALSDEAAGQWNLAIPGFLAGSHVVMQALLEPLIAADIRVQSFVHLAELLQ